MYDPTNSRYRFISFKGNEGYRRFKDENDLIKNVYPQIQTFETPAHGSYGALLFREEWKKKRELILKRDKYACVVCKEQTALHVHHRQYHYIVRENRFCLPWEYSDNLLLTLCELCHKRGHSKFKVPTINI